MIISRTSNNDYMIDNGVRATVVLMSIPQIERCKLSFYLNESNLKTRFAHVLI